MITIATTIFFEFDGRLVGDWLTMLEACKGNERRGGVREKRGERRKEKRKKRDGGSEREKKQSRELMILFLQHEAKKQANV